jgi:glycosyltransferase involved in cell wall biosynthesis
MPPAREREEVAVVVKGYPRLSETFIAQELLSLERQGLAFAVYSLRFPTDTKRHPAHEALRAPCRYLPEYLYRAPLRVLAGWRRARRLPGYPAARRAWLRDLARDPTPNRIRRFGQALVLAAEMPASVRHIYVHFLHTPGSVARYAAAMRALPWSCSAHAKDIYTLPDWEKVEKLREMEWLVTCTAANVAHLRALPGVDPAKVRLLYHGIDLDRFAPASAPRPRRDGSVPSDPVMLLSVGRAVAKKGYGVLLAALARLPANLSWRLIHIGGGAERTRLEAEARRLAIAERIEWRGGRSQDEVIAAYRAADLFVLASRIAGDGDRDGLPNVLMEAQSQGLACVSTRISAIPELVVDSESGLLVPPDDPDALAAAIARLIRAPEERRRMGLAGAERVRERFSHDGSTAELARRLGAPGVEAGASRVAAGG